MCNTAMSLLPTKLVTSKHIPQTVFHNMIAPANKEVHRTFAYRFVPAFSALEGSTQCAVPDAETGGS